MAKSITKAQLKQAIAENVGITQSQAEAVLDFLSTKTISELNTNGEFSIPNVCKLVKVVKKATAERTMISSLTKKEIIVKAKPAKNVVKAKPAKLIKETITQT